MIPYPFVSPSSRAGQHTWRRRVGIGLSTAFAVMGMLISTWGWRAWTLSQVGYKPDTSLLAPLVAAGPFGWLVASLLVGALATLVHAIAIRKGGKR